MAKALVYKATSDDTKDPSGFVLKELAQLSYVSPRECSTILEQLLKRLDKDKPDVKYKALRTIKYMCIHGRAEFRQELQRDNGLIKMCLHYKGPADPLRGDTPNQRVRDEAKECTNAIFNTTGTGRPGPSVSGRLEGFGSNSSSNHQHEAAPSALSSNPNTSSYSHGTYSSPHEYGGSVPKLESGAYSTGKMVGFGSSENTVSNSSSSILSKVKNRLTGTSDEIQRPTFKPYDRTPTYESPQPAYDASATRRQAGAPGGVWGNAPAETLHSSNGRSSSSNHYGTVAAPPSASRMTNSTGEYESRLVDQITAPTGVRPTPLKEELTKFTQQCESLDKFMIAGLLDAKLGSTVWQQQMKALCVLESLLQTGSEEVEDYLCEHSGHLEELEHATNPQLKSKARRVLELCGLREEEKAVPSAAASYAAQTQSAAPVHHHQQQPATVNLLDFTDTPAPSSNELSLFDAPAVAKPAHAHAPAPAPAAGGFDFISGGTTTSSSAAVDDTSNLFGNMQIKATPAPATSSSSSSSSSSIDLFANTNIKTNPTPAPAATSPPSAFPFTQSTSPPPTTTPNNDPLAFLSEPTPSPATKSDPVAHLLATSSQKHPQPAYNAYQPPPSQAYPPYGAQPPYGTQPPYGYSAPPTLGYPPHGYPPHPQGYPPHAQPGYPAPGQAPPQQPYLPPFAQPAKPNPAKDFTFHVQAASTNQRQPLNLNGLPELGNGTKPTSTTTSSSFGFIAEKPADSFGFVNDMLKS